jgi:hypothetical protein
VVQVPVQCAAAAVRERPLSRSSLSQSTVLRHLCTHGAAVLGIIFVLPSGIGRPFSRFGSNPAFRQFWVPSLIAMLSQCLLFPSCQFVLQLSDSLK